MPHHSATTFATRDPSEAREHVAQNYTQNVMHLDGPTTDFRFTSRAEASGSVGSSTVTHTSAVHHETEGLATLMVARPAAGSVWMSTREGRVESRQGQPFVVAAPGVPYDIGWGGPMSLEMLTLRPEHFSDLAGRFAPDAHGYPRFTSYAPVAVSLARHCAQTMTFVRGQLFGTSSVRDHALVQDASGRLLAASLLAAFPHVAPESLRVPSAGSAPVRRAVAFVEEHAAEEIGLAEMARAAGVGPRALQLAFRRHLGTTPREHLRRVRLDGAHRDLLAADPTLTSVSDVASRWGFGHLGRFAADYRAAHGRLPRETLSS